MKKKFITLALAGAVTISANSDPACAEVYQSVDKTYNLDSAPIDMTGSIDGKYTFILTEGGKVIIYSATGEKNEIQVDPTMDQIFTTGQGDKIYLSSKKSKKVQEVYVDFDQQIDISKSPFLGDENGRVAIVVFSDFQ